MLMLEVSYSTWPSRKTWNLSSRAHRVRLPSRQYPAQRDDGQRRHTEVLLRLRNNYGDIPSPDLCGDRSDDRFGPLLENPKILLLGAAGQFGIFLTLLLALALGFSELEAVCMGIIGACDGPTAIYVTTQYAPQLLGAVSVAAYSYMALVPIIQPPIMRALTTEKERTIRMTSTPQAVSKTTRILFPIVVTLVTGLIAPKGLPLMGMIMLGNFLKESGVVTRLTSASENEIANVVTLFLGLAIGGTMEGHAILEAADPHDFRSRVCGYLSGYCYGCHFRQAHVCPFRWQG